MRALKSIIFSSTFAVLCLAAVGCAKQQPTCSTQSSCLSDPNCQCWCSQKCGWRKKESNDHPTYIPNDPNGKFCYCKQWDYDYYKDNCVDGKKVLQPAGAQ